MTERILLKTKHKLSIVNKLVIPTIEEDAKNSLCIYLCSVDLTYKIITKTEYSEKIREFYKQIHYHVMTTRFTVATFNENQMFRNKNPSIGCVYGSPVMVTATIPIDRPLFILEMNNDTNVIEGIGMVLNHPCSKSYRVYSRMNYNRFIYIGKYRIDKTEFNENEKEIIELLEAYCFKGLLHMKRGHGITGYTTKLLFNFYSVIDISKFIKEMFNERIPKNKLK